MKESRTPRWLKGRGKVQALSTVVLNSYFLKDLTGGFCVPVLNCWACPAAIASCPLGALQHASGEAGLLLKSGAAPLSVIPFYILGTLMAFSVLLGRFMCGWLCPFGWLQDLLARLSRRKFYLPAWTGYLRYVFLVGLVFVVPYLTTEQWFSKVCPQGALQGGIFQPLVDPSLRAGMGTFWYIKQTMLVAWLVAFVFIRRPFCRLMCPLGAIFALFNRVSILQTKFDPNRCTNCGWCQERCPAGLDPCRQVNSHLCISCLECQKCPQGAISLVPIWRWHGDSEGQVKKGNLPSCPMRSHN